jgi:hypothetical protein
MSLVVPGSFHVIETEEPTIALKRVDFPELTLPIIATFTM